MINILHVLFYKFYFSIHILYFLEIWKINSTTTWSFLKDLFPLNWTPLHKKRLIFISFGIFAKNPFHRQVESYNLYTHFLGPNLIANYAGRGCATPIKKHSHSIVRFKVNKKSLFTYQYATASITTNWNWNCYYR